MSISYYMGTLTGLIGAGGNNPTTGNYEPETEAYWSANGLSASAVFHSGTPQQRTGTQLKTAVDNFLKTLKNASFPFSKIHAAWFLNLGSFSASRVNLFSPNTPLYWLSDISGAAWQFGPFGFNSDNGGVLSTGINPSAIDTGSGLGMGFARTNQAAAFGDRYDMGAYNAHNRSLFICPQYIDANGGNYGTLFSQYLNHTRFREDQPHDARGFWFTTNPGFYQPSPAYRDGVLLGNSAADGTLPNGDIYLGALNIFGGTIYGHQNGTYPFACVTKHLTDSEAATLATAVLNYQTELNIKTY